MVAWTAAVSGPQGRGWMLARCFLDVAQADRGGCREGANVPSPSPLAVATAASLAALISSTAGARAACAGGRTTSALANQMELGSREVSGGAGG